MIRNVRSRISRLLTILVSVLVCSPPVRAQLSCANCNIGGTCPLPCDASATCEAGGYARDCCLFTGLGNGCPSSGQTALNGCCCDPTPIVIDVDGTGVNLTNASEGVFFDIGDDGQIDRVSWTRSGSSNAWLALDRNRNGVIDNGIELFGNATPQSAPPAGSKRNGFLALAEFDKPMHGGNGDGRIDREDLVFRSLLLWQDTNHDGVSQKSELHPMQELGVEAVDLNYADSRIRDRFGNLYRYRSRVKHRDGAGGRWAWDVILRVDNSLLPSASAMRGRP